MYDLSWGTFFIIPSISSILITYSTTSYTTTTTPIQQEPSLPSGAVLRCHIAFVLDDKISTSPIGATCQDNDLISGGLSYCHLHLQVLVLLNVPIGIPTQGQQPPKVGLHHCFLSLKPSNYTSIAPVTNYVSTNITDSLQYWIHQEHHLPQDTIV